MEYYIIKPLDRDANRVSELQANDIQNTVINGGYCIGCGACAALSGSFYSMALDEYGRYQPVLKSEKISDLSISKVCPFSDMVPSEDEIAADLFKESTTNYDAAIGFSQRFGAAWVTDTDARLVSSSGGIGTWLASAMLEKKLVDGVIHVRPNDAHIGDEPLFTYAISRTYDEIKSGRSSRYYPVEISQVLDLVSKEQGRFVFFGVPCFAKAIRLICRNDPDFAERIPYVIGLVCGHLKTSAYADSFALQMGIDPHDLQTINFRTKLQGRPANQYGVTLETLHNGCQENRTILNTELYGTNWGYCLFKPQACDYCDDIFAETADFVIGDAWLPEYVKDWRGTSVVVSRHVDLDLIFKEGVAKGEIKFNELSVDKMMKSQGANFRHRRDALPARLKAKDKEGLWRPRKRFESEEKKLDESRLEVTRLRTQLASVSQIAWRKAKTVKDLDERWKAFREDIDIILEDYEFASRSEPTVHGFIRVKNTMKIMLVAGLFNIIRSMRKLFCVLKVSKGSGYVAVLPPSSPGSLGDEAVVTSVADALKKRSLHPSLILSYSAADSWVRAGIDGASYLDISKYLAYESVKLKLLISFRMLFVEHLLVCGTDVLDGHYVEQRSLGRLNIARLASELGVPVTILGFSFSEQATPLVRKALRTLPDSVHLCVRDPISYEVVKSIVGDRAELVADPAFIMKPLVRNPKVEKLINWILDQRSLGRIILGVNANHLLLSEPDSPGEAALIDAYTKLISRLFDHYENLSVCLLPHDNRGKPSDFDLALKIFGKLCEPFDDRVTMLPEDILAAEVKAVVRELDFVFTGKKHLSVAALGSGIPVGCITYKDKKFLGLFSHFGLQDLLLPSSAWHKGDQLFDFVTQLIDNAEVYRERINQKLPSVVALSEKNFRSLV